MSIKTFHGEFPERDAHLRAQSLETILQSRPDDDQVWLFGYGSLMWDDIALADERRPARLDGWHRSLCVWSALARGRPAQPGICLGLDHRGRCDGVALRVAGPALAERLVPVWEREMWTDIYRPEWVSVDTEAGQVQAIAFVINHESAQFTGPLSPAEIAEHIAAASGEKGSCRDYLARVLAKLDDFGIVESDLMAMLDRVDAILARVENSPN